MTQKLPDDAFEALRGLDTCTVANAIETLDIELRNEGFATPGMLHCQFPALPPMLGYAVTLRIRSANPPMEGGTYLARSDWWEKLTHLPNPHVLVIEDMDRHPGVGALVGQIHSAILKSLGCVGVVTNGAVRDLPQVEPMGFSLFSGTVSPSHAYIHVVEFGGTVNMAGLLVHPGELLLGDRHGLVRIPLKVAEKLPAVVARIQAHEREILDYCKSNEFSLDALQVLMSEHRNP